MDCRCNDEKQVGFLFSMPLGKTMEIRSNRNPEDEIAIDEEVEGIVYKIYWNGDYLPWCTFTLLQANAIAFGCQWGAQEMFKKLKG